MLILVAIGSYTYSSVTSSGFVAASSSSFFLFPVEIEVSWKIDEICDHLSHEMYTLFSDAQSEDAEELQAKLQALNRLIDSVSDFIDICSSWGPEKLVERLLAPEFGRHWRRGVE